MPHLIAIVVTTLIKTDQDSCCDQGQRAPRKGTLLKLVLAIVKEEQAGRAIDALMASEYRATRINTAGGFLKRGNSTILVGVDDEKVDEVLAIMKVQAPGTTAFVLGVAETAKL
jgi:uncharacterized protein YaaQ